MQKKTSKEIMPGDRIRISKELSVADVGTGWFEDGDGNTYTLVEEFDVEILERALDPDRVLAVAKTLAGGEDAWGYFIDTSRETYLRRATEAIRAYEESGN